MSCCTRYWQIVVLRIWILFGGGVHGLYENVLSLSPAVFKLSISRQGTFGRASSLSLKKKSFVTLFPQSSGFCFYLYLSYTWSVLDLTRINDLSLVKFLEECLAHFKCYFKKWFIKLKLRGLFKVLITKSFPGPSRDNVCQAERNYLITIHSK